MGLGKTYSADYLIDSNGNTGVSGQVLISTATGIDWADGSAITGGPFLPLAGGTITGNVRFNDTFKAEFGSSADLQINHDATDSLINNGTGHLTIRNGANDKSIFLQADNGSGGNTSYLTLNGASTHAYFSNPGNVGIGVTSPNAKLEVTGDIEDNWAGRFENTNTGGYGILAKIAGTSADERIFEARVGSSTKMLISGNGNVGIGHTVLHQKFTVNGNIDIRGGDGSLLTFNNGDGGIGVHYNNADSLDGRDIAFKTYKEGVGNTEKMRITRDGNVGIGTTNPDSKLSVTSTTLNSEDILYLKSGADNVNDYLGIAWELGVGGNGPHSAIRSFGGPSGSDARLGFLTTSDGGTTLTEGLSVAHNGNVGIGATAPTGKLDVVGSLVTTRVLTTGSLSLIGTDATASAQTVLTISTGVGNATGPNIVLSKSRSQASGAVVTSDPLGTIQFQGGNGTASVEGARIQSIAGSTWSSTNRDSDLLFWTTPNASTTIAERMRITSSGNVGIGTGVPAGSLDVYGTTGSKIRIALFTDQNTDDPTLKMFYGKQTRPGYSFISDNTTGLFSSASGGFLGFSVSQSERMRITSAGNVGIGTTTPGSKLEIHKSITYGSYGPAAPQLNLVNTHTEGTAGFLMLSARYNNTSPAQTFYQVGGMGGGKETALANNEWGGYINFFTTSDGTAGAASGMFEHMRITADGNVGIGTTSPNTKLHVSGSIKAEGNGTDQYFFEGVRTGVGTTIRIYDNANTAYIDSYNNMAFRANQNGGSGGNFTFTGGNVGIGTTSPYGRLNVIPSSNPTTPTAANQISIGESSANSQYNLRLGYFLEGGAYKGSIQAISGNTPNTLILNGDGGNVGIGTTSPTHKLHVNGDMRLTGALRDSNNAKGSAGQVLSSTGSATDWIPLPATPTIYTPKVYNLNNSTNINSQGQKLVPDFGTLEIEGNTTIQQVSGSDTDFQVTGENTGIYEVTYAVFYKNTGNQRTPLGTYLTLNGTAVNGSLMVNYLRSDVAGGGNWSSCTNTFYVNVTDASHPIALCVRRADSSTAPSGISMVEPAGMAVKSTISFRRIS